MKKVYAKYFNKNGEVTIFQEDRCFSVLLQHRMVPGIFKCYVWNSNDLEEAIDNYKAGIDKLNNRVAARTCVANPNRRRKCSAKNCPKKTGGAVFWRMFRESCLNRTK